MSNGKWILDQSIGGFTSSFYDAPLTISYEKLSADRIKVLVSFNPLSSSRVETQQSLDPLVGGISSYDFELLVPQSGFAIDESSFLYGIGSSFDGITNFNDGALIVAGYALEPVSDPTFTLFSFEADVTTL